MGILRSVTVKILPESLKKRVRQYISHRYPVVSRRKLLSVFKVLMSIEGNYEPLQISDHVIDGKREWRERWNVIKAEIESYQASSIIDIGCAEGWFLRRAAEDLGCFAIGVEMDNKRIIPSEVARLHDDIERCAILKAQVGPVDLVKLPRCDVIICLSVVHHIMYSEGIEAAQKFVAALSTRANKAIIFEMGTSDEKDAWWSDRMPPIPMGQHQFIRSFLEDSGLINIRQIGNTLSIEKDADRLMFVAEPPNPK